MVAVDANLFPKIIIRESANDGSDFSNPSADYRVAFIGEDGNWHFKDSAGTVTEPGGGGVLNKYDATVAPAVTDDSGDGYSVGSVWIDVTGDDAYICVDASVGAAVWNPFESGGGALVGDRKPWDVAGTYPLSADGSEFEFADLTAFNAVWSRRNVADADIFNPPGSQTEFRLDAAGDAIYKTATFAADMWVVAEVSEGFHSDQMFALCILNTSGTGIGFGFYQGTYYNINVTAWEYASFGNSITDGTVDAYWKSTAHTWFGLERISTTSYRGAVSIDGTTWATRPTANTPTGFTPAYIGLVRLFGGTTTWRRVHRINTYTVAFP